MGINKRNNTTVRAHARSGTEGVRKHVRTMPLSISEQASIEKAIRKAGFKITYNKGFYAIEKSPVSIEIWDNQTVGNYDSRAFERQYLKKDEAMTKRLQADFNTEYGSKPEWRGYQAYVRDWLARQGLKQISGGNTYNDDNAYYWGDVFEWITFAPSYEKVDYPYPSFDDKNSGIVIFWHGDGDVRGNYADPIVYRGSVDEFFSNQTEDDPQEAIFRWIGKELVERVQAHLKRKKTEQSAQSAVV